MRTVNSNVTMNLASSQRGFFGLAGGHRTTSECWFWPLNIAHNMTHFSSRQGSDFILVLVFFIERCRDVYPVSGIPFISFSSKKGMTCDLCRRFCQLSFTGCVFHVSACGPRVSASDDRCIHSSTFLPNWHPCFLCIDLGRVLQVMFQRGVF